MEDKKVVVAAILEKELFSCIMGKFGAENEYAEVVNYIDTDEETVKRIASENHTELLIADFNLCAENSGQKKLSEFCENGSLNPETGDMTEILMIYEDANRKALSELQRELFKRKIPLYPLRINNKSSKHEKTLAYYQIKGSIMSLKRQKDYYAKKKAEADELIKCVEEATGEV